MVYLLIGIISGIFSAATAFLLGHGLMIALLSYSLGGIAGILAFVVLALLQRSHRAPDMAIIEN